jgi:hypothetical protein
MRTDSGRAPSQAVFAVAVFLSAFLLFAVQPLVGKAILPWFGGTPAVWTTCVLFFQLVLFGGYLYAHLIAMRLPPRLQAIVHVVLLAAACVFVRVLPGSEWKPQGTEPPVEWIVRMLLATVGLPYFLLSSTGPLLQWWFSRVHPGRSPYRLYALSNAGSLLALAAFPFLLEPNLSVTRQVFLWRIGFWIFAALGAACAATMVRAAPAMTPAPTGTPASPVRRTTVGGQIVWFFLAALPSATLLAMTNQVCQDAVVPFLWVAPLALYLLSFILCFDSDRWYRRSLFAGLTALLVVAVCVISIFGTKLPILLQAAIYFAALFAICMMCHGELARLRPPASDLTRFYLTLAAGGACGGLFVGVLAPLVFNDYWEFHICIIVSVLLAIGVVFAARGWFDEDRYPPLAAKAAGIVLVVLVSTVSIDAYLAQATALETSRNFYGVLRIERERQRADFDSGLPSGALPSIAVVMRHGRIPHGLQYEEPDRRDIPTTYYGFESGVGRALTVLKRRHPSLRVGVVGLGAGTLAISARNSDTVRFYEINPDVERLARKHFTFLADSPATVDVVLGDARLSLEREPPQEFDLLVMDAFSGDAIPTHLLTREAMERYLAHLKPGGVIAFHISNLHFDLQPVIAALADAFGMSFRTIDDEGLTRGGDRSSRWVLLTKDATLFTEPELAAPEVRDRRRILWTDDFNNLMGVLE